MGRPFLMLASGWAAGIGMAFQWGGSWMVWGLIGTVVLVAGALYYWWRMRGFLLTLCLGGCFLGAAHFSLVEASNVSVLPMPKDSPVKAVMEGTVVTPAEVDGDGARLELSIRRVHMDSRELQVEERILLQLRLRSPGEQQAALHLKRGTTLAVAAQLTRPDPARNPGAFDYRGYLHRKGIHLLGEGNFRDVHILSHHFSARGKLDGLQKRLEERLDRLYPPENAGLMKGMLLGDRAAVPPETEEDFRSLGLVHLLAISGLHVGVFAGCLYGGLTLVGVTREKAAFISLFALPFYTLLTGAGAPVVRASVMAGMGLLAVILGRWKDSLSFLGLAALVMLWWNPHQLMEAGFQLSFAVTCALLLATGPLSRQIPTRWPRLNQWLAVTLIAQVASFPILIFHFHEFSLLSWGVNLVVVPLMTALVIPLGMLSLLLDLVHESLSLLPAWLSSVVLNGVRSFLASPASWSGFRLPWIPPSGVWIAGYAASVFYLLWAWNGGRLRRFRHGWVSLGVSGVVLGFSLLGSVEEEEVRVTFLDVGQGDATVIETPGGRVILVDGGGNLSWEKEAWQRRRVEYEVGKEVVVPYLKYRGIRRVDWLVMTHGDADHIGGLRSVVDEVAVGRALRNPLPPGSRLEEELMGKLMKKKVPIQLPEPGTLWEPEPGIQLQSLYPPATAKKTQSDNDASIVFLLTAYGHRILLPADLEEAGEREILDLWELPPINFLKVGHHGSRTSTSEPWLETLRPRQAIISAGRNNRFGHPAPEVVERLKNHGIRVWRTDRHGAVTLRITPEQVKVEPMISER